MKAIYRGLAVLLTLPASFATAEIYELPPAGHDVIGAVTEVPARATDTLLDIARRHGLGYEDIVRANPGVDTWLPGEGTRVVLPTRFVLPPGPRRGVVLNLAEYRMYYYPEALAGEAPVVMTFPMSIGRMDWATPLGNTSIVSKVTRPSWYPPESIRAEHAADGKPLPRIVPPGPKNPLGDHAMRLGLPGYLIHGTNRPAGVGMRVTHGCIRMFPEDIAYLFDQVAVNTPVRIINEPIKLGWDGELLVLEVHRALDVAEPLPAEQGAVSGAAAPSATADAGEPGNLAGDDTASDGGGQLAGAAPSDDPVTVELLPARKNPLTTLTEQFVVVTERRVGELDWDLAEGLLGTADGIPSPVGRAIKNAATSAASR